MTSLLQESTPSTPQERAGIKPSQTTLTIQSSTTCETTILRKGENGKLQWWSGGKCVAKNITKLSLFGSSVVAKVGLNGLPSFETSDEVEVCILEVEEESLLNNNAVYVLSTNNGRASVTSNLVENRVGKIPY